MSESNIKTQLEIAKKVWVRTADIQRFIGCSYPTAFSIRQKIMNKYYPEGAETAMRGAILTKFFLEYLNVSLEDLKERSKL